MKGMTAVLWSLLLGAAGSAYGSDVIRESPMDYATGVMLETTEESPWYRLSLPPAVYQQTAWPDLRDVRVFNRQGDSVPFAMQVQKSPPVTPQTVSLRLFPLDKSPVSTGEEGHQGDESVLLRSQSGLEIHLQHSDSKALGQSYLLTLPENLTEPFSLAQLRLNWTLPAGNWQGKASVYYSQDLRDWGLAQEDTPLMELTHDNDHLKMDTIGTSVTLSSAGIRYLLLILDAQSPALTLNSVSAMAQSSQPESERIVLDSHATKMSNDVAVWRWLQPQPLNSLWIALEDEGVLPVELEWRSDENAAWQPLTKTVLYRLNGKRSEEIPLSGQMVEAVRMTTINARLPETLPEVTGGRDSYQLVFNAQGKGPYLLAWGNRAANRADVGLEMLIPAALHTSSEATDLPWAMAQESVRLGGASRLTAMSAADQQSRWNMFLVWGALIAGVAVLLAMAWRIWRELKTGGSA